MTLMKIIFFAELPNMLLSVVFILGLLGLGRIVRALWDGYL